MAQNWFRRLWKREETRQAKGLKEVADRWLILRFDQGQLIGEFKLKSSFGRLELFP
jgi:hypothetical protein